MNFINEILIGDSLEVLKTLPEGIADTCVTSPPYWGLRDYGVSGQLGQEDTPQQYVDNLVELFREVKRVLKKDGTCWLNIGDTSASFKDGKYPPNTLDKKQKDMPVMNAKSRMRKSYLGTDIKDKDLVGIPWMLAFALRADGWYLRSEVIWHKPNGMPERVKDRPTRAHEQIFLLSKSKYYYYDAEAIQESTVDGTAYKNKRDVWKVSPKPFKGAHFATFPSKLIEPCVLAGCPENGVVLDPFFGSGTTGLVSKEHDRNFIGIELNKEYAEIAKNRIKG